ncbi:hypothetical protein EL17_20605 [Anditalea andensis]|uniref:TonB-dependent receptor plug domain-containing protein n=2 Tax=Anditalea andensis TaxID=1048983 RepID=A0A074KUG4_9BACT|nr:hypothetical protein EL17_20605 [Anditalea andensis]
MGAGKDRGAITDGSGRFQLYQMSMGTKIKISYLGYESQIVVVNSPEEMIQVRLTPISTSLSEVTVTAFESDRKLMDIPAAIGYLGSRDLERFAIVSPHQAFSTLPGVKVHTTTIGRYQVKIRGGSMGTIGHGDNYKSYWNGIPITTSNGFNPLAYFDMGNVGNVSVIRGPSGSIYGAGINGVMLFESKEPTEGETSLQTDGLYGSYHTYRYNLEFASATDKGDIRLQYSQVHTDGYRQEAASDNEFISVSGNIRASEKGKVTFLAQYVDRFYGIPGNLNAGQVLENRKQPGNSPDFDNGLTTLSLMVGAAHDYRWNERWQNITSFSYLASEGTFLIGTPFFSLADETLVTSFSMRTATSYNFKTLGNRNGRWVIGGELTRGINQVNDFTDGFNSPIYSSRRSTDRVFLGFSQVEVDLPLDFTLMAGASFNNYFLGFREYLADDIPAFSKYVNDISPRLAITKKMGENIVLHGNISKGFTPPPRGAIDNTGRNINADLQSTTGLNQEIGIRGNLFDSRFHFDLITYRLNERNVILPKVMGNMGGIDLIRNENAGAINRLGIELTSAYDFRHLTGRNFSQAKLWTSYTYMHHVFDTYHSLQTAENEESIEISYSGKVIPGIHPHTLVKGADLAMRNGFYINATYSNYTGIYLNNENTDKDTAYAVLDFRSGIRRPLGSRFKGEIYAGINNALDERYTAVHNLNAFLGSYFDPAPGRNYYGGFSLKYFLLP